MKPTALLDTNVVIALSWAEHVHFPAARRWFLGRRGKAWATCPFTESGFIRIASNVRRTPGATSLADCVESLRRLRQHPGHQFWPADFSPAEDEGFARLQGHKQVTDAYLLTLAQRNRGQLATFDAAMPVLSQQLFGNADHVLLLDPAGSQREP